MTKAQLISAIAVRTGYDKTTIANVLESTTEVIKKTVAEDESIYMRGFGSFGTKIRAKKLARNISKNITIEVPEHRVVVFKPSPEFSDLVTPAEN